MTYEDIHNRFKVASELIFKNDSWGEFAVFCNEAGINKGNLSRAISHPDERKLRVEWIASFCERYNISAEWILTGRGKALR